MIITIDGPSGSGKSTLGLKLAKYLHFMYLNSGYLYRGLAYVLKNFYGYDAEKMKNPDPDDIIAIFATNNFQYVYNQGLVRIIWIDDITMHLKDPMIAAHAALLANDATVREQIHMFEYNLIENHDAVVEGRACGSVLYPHAAVKFYLTASLDVRASRLQKDQIKRGNLMLKQQAIDHTDRRDQLDYVRAIEPLIKPEGAIDLDSTHMDVQQIFEVALSHVKKAIEKQLI